MAQMQLVSAAPAPAPRRSRSRAIVKKAAGTARKAGSFLRQKAAEEKHTLTAVGSGLVLGFAESKGVSLPKFGPLSTAGTLGLAAWLIGRMTKNRMVEHVATGLLSIQAYEFGKGAGGPAMTGEDMLGVGDSIEGEI